MSEITRLHRNEASSFNARERDSFVKLCSTVVNELLPFVNTCLSHLFPQASLAESLGMTLRESHQICQLNLELLTEPLQLYIPREEIELESKMEINEAVEVQQMVKSAETSDKKVNDQSVENASDQSTTDQPVESEAPTEPPETTEQIEPIPNQPIEPTEETRDQPVESSPQPPLEPAIDQPVELISDQPVSPKKQKKKKKNKK